MAHQLKNLMGVGVGALTARQIIGFSTDGLTATGSSQADALPLAGDVNVVTTVPSNSGVRLSDVPQPGDEFAIANLGANPLNIYPGMGGSIQGGGANLPYVLNAGASAIFMARSGSLSWVVLSSGGTLPAGGGNGILDFSDLNQSGLLALLEDI